MILAGLLSGLLLVAVSGLAWWGNQFAISDTRQHVTHAAALLLALAAFEAATRPMARACLHHHGAEQGLVALANALLLTLLGGAIGYDAYQRLEHREAALDLPMTVVAATTLSLNGLLVMGLCPAHWQASTLRSRLLHMGRSALSSAVVLLASVAVLLTQWLQAEPVMELLIAIAIVWSSWEIVRKSDRR
jgi:cobalt-zinc-cadmium efflux system protein